MSAGSRLALQLVRRLARDPDALAALLALLADEISKSAAEKRRLMRTSTTRNSKKETFT
jgi:hypothetical protein